MQNCVGSLLGETAAKPQLVSLSRLENYLINFVILFLAIYSSL